MKQSISLPHVDSQHIRGEIAGRRSGQNTLKVKQSRQSSKIVCWSLVTRGYTHIFLHILRFDGLIRGVRRVERPKGKAAKKADKTGSEEGASAREHGLWVLTDTSQTHSHTAATSALSFYETQKDNMYLSRASVYVVLIRMVMPRKKCWAVTCQNKVAW